MTSRIKLLILLLSIVIVSCKESPMLPVQWFDISGIGVVYDAAPSIQKKEDFKQLFNQKFNPGVIDEFNNILTQPPQSSSPVETCNDIHNYGNRAMLNLATIAIDNCLIFKTILELKPSKVSYLPKVFFDEESIKAFPAELAPKGVTDFKSIEQYNVIYLSTKLQSVFIKDKDDGYRIYITAYAQGDFNKDGIEDVLVVINTTFEPGVSGSDKVVPDQSYVCVLTKKSPERKFEIVKILYREI